MTCSPQPPLPSPPRTPPPRTGATVSTWAAASPSSVLRRCPHPRPRPRPRRRVVALHRPRLPPLPFALAPSRRRRCPLFAYPYRYRRLVPRRRLFFVFFGRGGCACDIRRRGGGVFCCRLQKLIRSMRMMVTMMCFRKRLLRATVVFCCCRVAQPLCATPHRGRRACANRAALVQYSKQRSSYTSRSPHGGLCTRTNGSIESKSSSENPHHH